MSQSIKVNDLYKCRRKLDFGKNKTLFELNFSRNQKRKLPDPGDFPFFSFFGYGDSYKRSVDN